MTSTETAQSLTEGQRQLAAAYLASTRDELIQAVASLSPIQASFRREPDEWCIAEIIEHLALIEGRVHMLIAGLPDAAPSAPDRQDAEIDEFIPRVIPIRTSRARAPEAARPIGRCTASEALQDFIRERRETISLLESAPCLRGHVLPHPIFGPWDGYQWLLAASAHTARHLGQIREIQSAEAFPKSPNGVPA